jgi:hypothetical protein
VVDLVFAARKEPDADPPVTCVELRLGPSEDLDRQFIGSIRRLPLATLVRYALAAAHRRTEEESAASMSGSWGRTEALADTDEIVDWSTLQKRFDEIWRGRAGRRRLEESRPEFLEEVAAVACEGWPKPVKAIEDKYHAPRRTAQRWLERARKQGHPTRPESR